MSFKIIALPGDGIGPEIISSAIKILKKLSIAENFQFEIEEDFIGGVSIDKYGEPLTDAAINKCKASDVVLLGAVGGYKWDGLEKARKPETGLLKLRKALDLFANIRPAKFYSPLLNSSSLKNERIVNTDFVVFRELVGDVYFGEPRGLDDNRGWNSMSYTIPEVERIARLAFEAARKRKNKVTSVDKANVLESSQLWRRVVAEVHKNYPDVTLENMYVDNCAMQIVTNPKQFDVILTSNLFGDILSDISGAITGSLGMLPSASIGGRYALYEPIHGSAPDIAGKGIANPIATIASVGMMFEYSLKRPEINKKIEKAIEKVLEAGFRTLDIAEDKSKYISTDEMTVKILEAL
jgi:3-isopropylmalate dehydrogenase